MIAGHCLCGAVTLDVEGQRSATSACHCTMCRRWSGSALWGFDAPAAGVTVTGPVRVYRGSAFAERAFCAICGSHLWFREDGEGHELAPGLFDAAAAFPLAREVYADRAPGWLRLEGDHARVAADAYEAERPHV
jgi:hypothetical protein